MIKLQLNKIPNSIHILITETPHGINTGFIITECRLPKKNEFYIRKTKHADLIIELIITTRDKIIRTPHLKIQKSTGKTKKEAYILKEVTINNGQIIREKL